MIASRHDLDGTGTEPRRARALQVRRRDAHGRGNRQLAGGGVPAVDHESAAILRQRSCTAGAARRPFVGREPLEFAALAEPGVAQDERDGGGAGGRLQSIQPARTGHEPDRVAQDRDALEIVPDRAAECREDRDGTGGGVDRVDATELVIVREQHSAVQRQAGDLPQRRGQRLVSCPVARGSGSGSSSATSSCLGAVTGDASSASAPRAHEGMRTGISKCAPRRLAVRTGYVLRRTWGLLWLGRRESIARSAVVSFRHRSGSAGRGPSSHLPEPSPHVPPRQSRRRDVPGCCHTPAGRGAAARRQVEVHPRAVLRVPAHGRHRGRRAGADGHRRQPRRHLQQPAVRRDARRRGGEQRVGHRLRWPLHGPGQGRRASCVSVRRLSGEARADRVPEADAVLRGACGRAGQPAGWRRVTSPRGYRAGRQPTRPGSIRSSARGSSCPNTGKWKVMLRGDVGGFGVGSQFAWQVRPTVAYSVSKHWAFGRGVLGARHGLRRRARSGDGTTSSTT